MPKKKQLSKEDQTDYLNYLPEELWVEIFSYLEKPKELLDAGLSCQTFSNITKDEVLWRQMNQRHGIHYAQPEGAKNNLKQIYENPLLGIEQKLNTLISKIEWDPTQEKTLHQKIQAQGYQTDNLVPSVVAPSLDKATDRLKNAKLLFDHIVMFNNSFDPSRYELTKYLAPATTLKDLMIKLYSQCEFNEFIKYMSANYEHALTADCPIGSDINLFLMLHGYINSLEENINLHLHKRIHDEIESDSPPSKKKKIII